LYQALLDDAATKGYREALGVIALPNDLSVRLHEKLGFVKVAHLEKIGYKFNQWIDVSIWQKHLTT
jgi:L-amino acid N-acyltransferase YncA